MLYRRGDAARQLFVVQSGTMAVLCPSGDGRQALVALLGSGEVLGLCNLFDDTVRSTEARALEPSTVVSVPYERIRRVIEQRPALLWTLSRLLADRLRALDQALADNVFLDVTGRTAKRLIQLAGDAQEFELPVTQEELASLVGASRERVNKALATFTRLGWLEQRDRRYRITDRQQLARRAGAA